MNRRPDAKFQPNERNNNLQPRLAFRVNKHPLVLAALSLAIGCAFGSSTALAEGFTYHGTLEQAGAPANGSYDLKLTLYSAEQGGQVLAGPLQIYNVDVHDGAFSANVDLDALTNLDRTVWLGVEVKAGNGGYEALSGRSPIEPTASACPGSWTLDGNAGNPANSFLGTADDKQVLVKANNQIGLQIVPSVVGPPAVNLSPLATTGVFGPGSTSVSFSNGAYGRFSFAGGWGGMTHYDGSFVWAGYGQQDSAQDSAKNQFVIGASGGVGINMSPEVDASPNYHRNELSIKSNGSGNAGNMDLSVIKLVSGTDMSGSMSVDKDGLLSLYPGSTTGSMSIGRLAGSGTIYLANKTGIKRLPTTNELEVQGNASKSTAGSWLANSDGRIKQDIQPITGALDTLARIRPVTFRYSASYRGDHASIVDHRYYNVVAQEFAEVFPDAVHGSGEYLKGADKTADNEILQVDTYPALITTVAAVQELAAENAALKAQLKSLSERLDQLAAKAGR